MFIPDRIYLYMSNIIKMSILITCSTNQQQIKLYDPYLFFFLIFLMPLFITKYRYSPGLYLHLNFFWFSILSWRNLYQSNSFRFKIFMMKMTSKSIPVILFSSLFIAVCVISSFKYLTSPKKSLSKIFN